MRIATEVKGYLTVPAPADIVYAPIDLAIEISNGLVKRGHSVDFYAPEGSALKAARVVTCGLEPLANNYQEYHDILIDPALQSDNVLATWDQRMAAEMFQRADRGEYDVLHFHHPEVALPFVNIYPNVPVVYTMHDPIDPLQYRILQMHKSQNQHFVSISDKQRETAPGLNYTATVHNGIDTDVFTMDATKHRDDYLLFLGSIVPRKGAKEAVEVAMKTGRDLLIVGPTYPDYQDYFNKYIKPYLSDKIRYLGHIEHDKTPALFQKASAFLMPIQWEEPFGLTMTEAMACGAPVVALRRGSVPEIVKDHETGYIVDSVDEMVQAIAPLSKIDPKVCRQHAIDNFSIQKMIEGYEAVFTQVSSADTKQ